jgi:hypothetical protein
MLEFGFEVGLGFGTDSVCIWALGRHHTSSLHSSVAYQTTYSMGSTI